MAPRHNRVRCRGCGLLGDSKICEECELDDEIPSLESIVKAERNTATARSCGLDSFTHAQLLDDNPQCEICGRESDRTLHVDHCHRSGNFRGMLCSQCNSILGFAADDPTILRKAAEYLEKHGSQRS